MGAECPGAHWLLGPCHSDIAALTHPGEGEELSGCLGTRSRHLQTSTGLRAQRVGRFERSHVYTDSTHWLSVLAASLQRGCTYLHQEGTGDMFGATRLGLLKVGNRRYPSFHRARPSRQWVIPIFDYQGRDGVRRVGGACPWTPDE